MRTKGKPNTVYDELKARITVSITPTAIKGIDALAMELGVGRSEVIEQIGRGLLRVSTSTS
jgi:metal-responsive CopG/Arc/MetJ family transcriptional regulator